MTAPVCIDVAARRPVVVSDTALHQGERLATLTMRLRSRPGSGSGPEAARVLEYRQFRNTAARSAFLIGRPRHVVAYDVVDVIVPHDGAQLIIEPAHLVQTVVLRTSADRVAEAVRSNVDETRSYFRRCAGFVGAAIHSNPAGTVFELLAWRSPADLEAAASTERFREHVREDYELARDVDIARYELA